MTTKTRSPREQLLATLSPEELAKIPPLSEGKIRTAVEKGLAEADASRTTEPLPPMASTLRFQ
jgi:hypothetical protein